MGTVIDWLRAVQQPVPTGLNLYFVARSTDGRAATLYTGLGGDEGLLGPDVSHLAGQDLTAPSCCRTLLRRTQSLPTPVLREIAHRLDVPLDDTWEAIVAGAEGIAAASTTGAVSPAGDFFLKFFLMPRLVAEGTRWYFEKSVPVHPFLLRQYVCAIQTHTKAWPHVTLEHACTRYRVPPAATAPKTGFLLPYATMNKRLVEYTGIVPGFWSLLPPRLPFATREYLKWVMLVSELWLEMRGLRQSWQ